MGEATAREGDLICVMGGCQTPLVLREKGERHELIGDAYVHGLMNGVAIDMHSKGAFESQVFVLE